MSALYKPYEFPGNVYNERIVNSTIVIAWNDFHIIPKTRTCANNYKSITVIY